MAQGQRPVTTQVHVPDLDVGFASAQIVLLGQLAAQRPVTPFVVNGTDLQFVAGIVVEHREEAELAHQAWRQILRNETLVLEVLHRKVEGVTPVGASNLGKPFAVFCRGFFADTPDVAPHRKPQRIRVDARVVFAVVRWLVDHVGVRLQKLQHEAVGYPTLVVQRVEQRVVPERGPAFIHDLGLALRVKILPDLAYDAHHLALPRVEQRGMFFNEVQQIFFRLDREAFFSHPLLALELWWQGAPQVVDLGLLVIGTRLLAQGFLRQ